MSILAPLASLRAYELAEYRSQLTRLGMAAGFGSTEAAKALAEISADATIEHALKPGDPYALARYDATVQAEAMYLVLAGSNEPTPPLATQPDPGDRMIAEVELGHPRHAAEAAFRQAVDRGLVVADRYTVMRVGTAAEARKPA